MLVKHITHRTGDRIDFSRDNDPSNPRSTNIRVLKCSGWS